MLIVLGVAIPSEYGLYFFLTVGAVAFVGFLFLASSLFLPPRKGGRPNFMQELLGKESLHYGDYTKGNWTTVLDNEKKRREAKKRKRSA